MNNALVSSEVDLNEKPPKINEVLFLLVIFQAVYFLVDWLLIA